MTELVERLNAAVGSIKARKSGFTAGRVLVGIAAAQLCGENYLVGLDRHRADLAGRALTPLPGLRPGPRPGWPASSPKASGAVETGLGDVHTRALNLLGDASPNGHR